MFDIMLPEMDGLTAVRRLREEKNGTPVLLLTARDASEDIVAGLDAGADDYLTKPFSFQVLLARLRALARRKQVDPRTELRVADLVLDPAAHTVTRGTAHARSHEDGIRVDGTPDEKCRPGDHERARH